VDKIIGKFLFGKTKVNMKNGEVSCEATHASFKGMVEIVYDKPNGM